MIYLFMEMPSSEQDTKDIVPEILYRGITLKVEDFEQDNFSTTLKAGSDEIDAKGTHVVSDGNEYGVYMSSNPQMVKTAYYGRSKESLLTEPFVKDLSLGTERSLNLPSVGVFFEIKTEGLEVRKPNMTQQLLGVANNGFVGAEYIADEIPSSNYKIKELCLSEGVYDKKATVYPIETKEDYENAKQDILKRYNDIKAKRLRFRDEIASLTNDQRYNHRIVSKIYENIFGMN